MAGIVAGRYIGGARSISIRQKFAARWKSIDGNMKNCIKNGALSIMGHNEAMIRNVGANIVAKIDSNRKQRLTI